LSHIVPVESLSETERTDPPKGNVDMKPSFRLGLTAFVLFAASQFEVSTVQGQVNAELDAMWFEVSRTVEEGDFEGYSAVYHPDAVLVTSTASYPIAQALERWKQGFVTAKSGATTSDVAFRFSQRLNDQTTAHETGIFRYSFQSGSGEATVTYIRFEALLVKTDGWKMIMEYQRSETTEEEWDALR
jgi:hypothetical protein